MAGRTGGGRPHGEGGGRPAEPARPLSRRDLLGLGVGGAAALVLGACSDGSDGPRPRASTTTVLDRPDPGTPRRVLVVGAGLAGLTAALDLVEAGWQVTVLEARDRVGGRVHTVRDPFGPGLHAEAGGESIDDGHHDLLALLGRFGLRTERRPADKVLRGLTSWQGGRERTSTFVGRRAGKVAVDYARFYAALDEVAADVDPDHPDRAADAERLDARSVADLTDQLDLVPEARFLVDTDNRGEFNADPSDVSLLFAAQQAASGEDVQDETVESMRIRGGNDQLPAAMADELGAVVVTGAPVTRIEHHADRVRVTAGGRVHDGAWLVLACPPAPLRSVDFSPALPAAAAAVVAGLDLGDAAKVTLEYRTRFWEDEGLSGFTVSDRPFGIAWSPTDSYASEAGLLTAFLTGPGARAAAAQDPAARIAAVRSQFDAVYPAGAGQHAAGQATTAWAHERYTGGGYAVHHPGQFAAFWPVLRQGTGRIRFAGEHTEALAGYMESAVRSGHRVAAALPAPPPR